MAHWVIDFKGSHSKQINPCEGGKSWRSDEDALVQREVQTQHPFLSRLVMRVTVVRLVDGQERKRGAREIAMSLSQIWELGCG